MVSKNSKFVTILGLIFALVVTAICRGQPDEIEAGLESVLAAAGYRDGAGIRETS